MSYKNTLKKLIPPVVFDAYRKIKNSLFFAEWEHIPQGWNYKSKKIKGWDLTSIVALQCEKWDAFCKGIEGSSMLGINHEASDYDGVNLVAHNTLMCFSYACASAVKDNKLRLLDWGGGIGHYGKVAESILPDINIEYTCYDFSVFCDAAQEIYPQAKFYSDTDVIFKNEYDLVNVSSSLWYDINWKDTLSALLSISSNYIYLTRMVFVDKSDSFVAIQRPYSSGYKTEYLCWIFNKNELVNFVHANGFKLIKEVFISEGPLIYKAREQGKMLGFLFKRINASL
jgi:putative methyltransferase (TIGR04325 family)